MTKKVMIPYRYGLGGRTGEQDESWTSDLLECLFLWFHSVWVNGNGRLSPFLRIPGFPKKNKANLVYPDSESVFKSVSYDTESPDADSS